MVPQKNRIPLFIISAVLFAVYFFIFGESGVIERMHLKGEHERIQQSIDSLKEENQKLVERLSQYRKGQFFREEALRSGYVEPGIRLIFSRVELQKRPQARSDVKDVAGIELFHLRVLWIVVSLLVLLLYGIRLKRRGQVL